jgi:ribose 5-phosphate isomerase B
MKIGLGADKHGYQLKEAVKKILRNKEIEFVDHGVNEAEGEEPYYQVASQVAGKVSSGEYQKAILVCGTGMGMAIIANKHPGVYAAVCENSLAAERSRSINDSNVLTLGGFVTSPVQAEAIIDAWLKTEFTQGWDSSIAEWLKNSKSDITKVENSQFKTGREKS